MTGFKRKETMPRSVLFCVLAVITTGFATAQDAQPPIAPPADTNAAPPVALPADTNAPPVPSASTDAAPGTTPGLVILNPAATRFDSAMALFNGGQYADAVAAFSDFIRAFPQDRRREEALYRLAESYRNLGRTDDALAAYTFEVQNYPDGPLRINAELRRGAILFDAGKFTDAIPPLQRVASQGAGEVQEAANYLLGRCDLATQKETEGRALLQPLADQTPPGKYTGPAAQALAELDDSQNHYSDALALWQKALALTTDVPTQATLAARGGWSALGASQPDAAEKLFQTARKLDPSGDARKVANTGLLRLLFQQKRFTEWLAVYGAEKDKVLDSARAEIIYDLGHAQFTAKHWSEAAEAFDQYLREFGSQPNAVTAAYERFLAGTQMDRAKTVSEAEAYLKAWPQSPFRARVQLVEAQELSAEKNFAQALPLWESLAAAKGDADWPHQAILLELARSYDELRNWPKAATAYQAYLDDLSASPGDHKKAILRAQARLAVCLQNADQLLAATQAWQAVQSQAPAGSPEQEMALESLGLIYAKGGPAQADDMAAAFRALLQQFPQSPLRAMAAFSVGDAAFRAHDYAGAEAYLLEARQGDAATWAQPATQRLALGAYGMKNYNKTVSYVKQYDALPVPATPSLLLPPSLFYWLGQTAQQAANWSAAEIYYSRFLRNPDLADFIWSAWWNLGQVQSQRKEWAAAVASYQKCRDLHAQSHPNEPELTDVLLAQGRAQLGAGNIDAAKALGNQALLQEPEGPNSAAARTLLAETAFTAQSYAEAARMFATLALLFDDPKITPQAMSRAADAFDRAGDAASAAGWRQKLQAKYPQFRPAPYL
jgi:tetratricopeptide (TPR) repeat protein